MSNLSSRPKFGFSHMNVAIFLVFARNVLLKLTANPNFMTVAALLANLSTLIEEYADSIDAAFYRDKIKIAERNAKRESVENYLKMLAGIIMGISSDREILLTSGFEVTDGKGPVEPVGQVEGLKFSFETGMEGAVKLRWLRSSVKDAASFVIEQTVGEPSPDSVWSIVLISKKCSCSIQGLTQGQTYSWRVYGVGAMGAGFKSEPVSTIIL